jgi:hypothetical protein
VNIRKRKRSKRSKHHEGDVTLDKPLSHPDQPQVLDQLDDDNMLKLEQEVDEEELKEHEMLYEKMRNEEISESREVREHSHQERPNVEGEIDCRNDFTRAVQIIDAMAL